MVPTAGLFAMFAVGLILTDSMRARPSGLARVSGWVGLVAVVFGAAG